MFKTFTKNKSLLLTVLGLVLLFVVYNNFFSQGATSLIIDPQVEIIGADIVKTFSNLQSVNLDQALFSEEMYLNLVDFSREIPSQPVGRANPFDVLGRN